MSLLANRQPKAEVKPASGSCRWVLPIGEVDTGVLAINGHNYTVTVLRGPNGILGYRMVKADGTAYDIGTTEERWTCDCPDATFQPERPGGCKHVAALRAALKAAASSNRNHGAGGAHPCHPNAKGGSHAATPCNPTAKLGQHLAA